MLSMFLSKPRRRLQLLPPIEAPFHHPVKRQQSRFATSLTLNLAFTSAPRSHKSLNTSRLSVAAAMCSGPSKFYTTNHKQQQKQHLNLVNGVDVSSFLQKQHYRCLSLGCYGPMKQCRSRLHTLTQTTMQSSNNLKFDSNVCDILARDQRIHYIDAVGGSRTMHWELSVLQSD